jgi:hypothetical protein
MQNTLSVVDRLCRNPFWLPPVISCTHVVSVDRKAVGEIYNVTMLTKIRTS